MTDLKTARLEKSHVGIQFMKYSLCGGFALGVDMVICFLVAWLLFPALTQDDMLVKLFSMQVDPVLESVRVVNFRISNACAFMGSNLVAYLLNVRFVFKAGKHSRWKEIGLFYLVSAISVGMGTEIGAMLIENLGLSFSFSYIAKAISTTLINFVARKFIIFHG